MEINKEKIINTDISFLLNHTNRTHVNQEAQLSTFPQQEHYKLLTYISHQFDGASIIEFGTEAGLSSMCLAQNPTNTIDTYDVLKWKILHTPKNIKYHHADMESVSTKKLLEASLIFIDVNHTGVEEKKLTDRLFKIGYKGFLLCDDIGPRFPNLQTWFRTLPWPIHDLTSYGHHTGTGLVDCGYRGVTFT